MAHAATTIAARPIPAARRGIIEPMGWELGGALASVLLGATALLRSRGAGGFYDADVYGMTPVTHRRYAFAAAIFAVAFFALAVWAPGGAATIWVLAAFVLIAVFYITSYLRGASDSDD
jgi:small-conductance mechanosensitive channel